MMHNNDTHANLENAAKTVTTIKEYRVQKPNALLVNAGDVSQVRYILINLKGKPI